MDYHEFITLDVESIDDPIAIEDASYSVEGTITSGDMVFVKLVKDGITSIWKLNEADMVLEETQNVTTLADGTELYNGEPKENGKFYAVGNLIEIAEEAHDSQQALDFFEFTETIKDGTVLRWGTVRVSDGDSSITIYYQMPTDGADVLSPGLKYKVDSDAGATVYKQNGTLCP